MSDQTYASPNDPYWLSSRGVQSVSFDKQAAPPLAYLDKGILYELNDGVLYFNGIPLSSGGGGDVSGPASSDDNALARFDGATGKIIQNSNLILEDGSGDSVVLNGKPAASTLPMMLCTDGTQKTTLGLRTPIDSSLGIGSTAIGNGAMQLSTAASNCTAVGADALYQIGTGNNNVAIGAAAGLQLQGTDSRNILIDSPGVLGDNNTIRVGNPLFHTRAFIQGISGITTAGAAVPVLVDASGQLGTISSSMHVKDNIRPVEDTSFLHSLEICNFEYKGSTQKSAGVIAEVVEQLKPEIVLMQGNGVKTVDYQYMFVCALKEIQKLKSAHDALAARVGDTSLTP